MKGVQGLIVIGTDQWLFDDFTRQKSRWKPTPHCANVSLPAYLY